MAAVEQLIGQEIEGSFKEGTKYASASRQGIKGASRQLAQARALFAVPAYHPTAFDAEIGKPTGWVLNPYQYQPGWLQKLAARRVHRRGQTTRVGSFTEQLF